MFGRISIEPEVSLIKGSKSNIKALRLEESLFSACIFCNKTIEFFNIVCASIKSSLGFLL